MMSLVAPRLKKFSPHALTRRFNVVGAVVATLAWAPGIAAAAQPGELAAASRARLTISASVAARAAASGVTDASLAPAPGARRATALQRVCIRSNSVTGRYDLAATGEADGTGFVMTSADGATVPLTLYWTDAATQSAALLPGVPLEGLTAGREACSAASPGLLAAAAPATRKPVTGLITLLVAPL